MSEVEYRDPGEPPVIDWVDVDLLDIDEAYQRQLDEARVERIVTWFDWRSFGALVVAKTQNGRFNVVDGQHRAEAARRHPNVNTVPAVIIAATGTPAEAEVFVTVNRDRKNVTPLQLYWAELAAGDDDARTVAMVVQRAGLSIVRSPGGATSLKPRDTTAIGAIRSLVSRRGAMKARQILEVLGKAELQPVSGLQIRAAEILMTDPEFCNDVEPEALTESVTEVTDDEARGFAKTHRLPVAKAMASVWFRKTRKRRRAAA